jgi:hypothetical protein
MTVSEHAVTVRKFELEDEERVLALLQETFGRWPGQIESMTPAEFFHWKHRSSPFGNSLMYVGELDSELAGFTAYMPWHFTDGPHMVSALRGVDLAVAPRFRRRGVNLAIRATASSLTGAAFIWGNPNQPALRVGLRAGRSSSERIPHFARFCGRSLQSVRRAANGGARTPAQVPIGAQRAGVVLADTEYVDFVLRHMTHRQGCLATARDVHYLRWRYGRLADYHAVRGSSRDGHGGIAIFRLRRYRTLWITDICELLLVGNRRAAGRQLIHEIRDAAASDLMTCSFGSRREAAAFAFVRASRGATLTTYRLEDAPALDLTSARSWALSRGDLELL